MDWISVFSNFGYPAAVSGALLWIMVKHLDRVETTLDHLSEQIAVMQKTLEMQAKGRNKSDE